MFYHLQYIHLFRPFLKYSPSTSPLPPHVSPRRICTANAGFISKLMRLYKKLYNVRQICNIAVYMLHSACTIHLLNLPEKTARRDIIHGVKHLEEIAEDWPCARRTLSILSVLARKWSCELPEEAAAVLRRTDDKYGPLGMAEVPSPHPVGYTPSPPSFAPSPAQQQQQQRERMMTPDNFLSMPPPPTTCDMAPPPPSQQQEPVVTTWAAMSAGMGQPQPPPAAMLPPYYHQPPPPPPFAPTASSSSSSSYALDGKDWFLKDSVNLQQNFESWNNTSHTNTTTTMPSSSSSSSRGADIFMFHGLQESDMDLGDGWDFDSAL